MNVLRHSKVKQRGPLGTVAAFLIERPGNVKVTVVDRAVVLLSRVTMMLIILGVSITFYEVVMRYVFNRPTSWVYGKTLWLGAIIYLVAGAYAMQQRNHIRITAIYNSVPAWLKMTFDYLSLFIIVVYATLMVVGGNQIAFADFMDWIEHGRLLNPTMAGTIKWLLSPLIICSKIFVDLATLITFPAATKKYVESSNGADNCCRHRGHSRRCVAAVSFLRYQHRSRYWNPAVVVIYRFGAATDCRRSAWVCDRLSRCCGRMA